MQDIDPRRTVVDSHTALSTSAHGERHPVGNVVEPPEDPLVELILHALSPTREREVSDAELYPRFVLGHVHRRAS